jgi:uncharacterized membrane protein
LLLFFLILPLLFLLVFFNLAAISFARLGLSPEAAIAFFLASVAGSVINIPVSRERVVVRRPANLPFFLFYYPPAVEERVICINVGGALLPAALSLYLLATVSPLLPAVLATLAVALLAKAMARPVPVWALPGRHGNAGLYPAAFGRGLRAGAGPGKPRAGGLH